MTAKDSVRKYILENFLFTDDTNALRDDDSLLDKGIIDSTGVMELIAFIEAEFHIKVTESEMIPDNLDSVHHIARFVASKHLVKA